MKHASFFAVVVVALLGFAAPAGATHTVDGLGCGDRIETPGTVLVDSDIVCDGVFAGLVIEADNVTLNLGGHKISGTNGSGSGVYAFNDSSHPARYSNLTIRNGTIEGFVEGVTLQADDSTAVALTINPGDFPFAGPVGINMSGARNLAMLNVITFGEVTPGSGTGIGLFGVNCARTASRPWCVHATRNVVHGPVQQLIYTVGDDPRVAVNTLDCQDTTFSRGILVTAYTDSAVVARNNVTGCIGGGSVGISVDGGIGVDGGLPTTHTEVRRNVATANADGIIVDGADVRLWRNTANQNTQDGIRVNGGDQAVVEQNTANNNGRYGISAAFPTPGTGNTATGNGTQDCVNVSCGP